MNASGVIVLLLVAVVAAVSAFPAVDELKKDKFHTLVNEEEATAVDFPEEVVEEEERGLRFRRVTCDILSVSIPFVTLNHSACAAHCISKRKGFKGGRCKNGVCHCRR